VEACANTNKQTLLLPQTVGWHPQVLAVVSDTQRRGKVSSALDTTVPSPY
jgi:hypothetical protein